VETDVESSPKSLPEKPHMKLQVWQKAMDLVAEVYSRTQLFPATERFGLASQMRRSAVSIPSNIAEGAARHSRKEYCHFLYMARGSVSELDTQLRIARRLDYLADDDLARVLQMLEEVGRMLSGLLSALRK
jgi:four helix bundle protein